MNSIDALSLAPDAADWLANPRHPRILHLFDHACNLLNERREVLSIVTPQIGNGPFNLVIPGLLKALERLADSGASRQTSEVFLNHLNLQSPISISPSQLTIGDLTINTANAKLWTPRPDWEMLYGKRDTILNQLMSLRATLSKREGARSHPRYSQETPSSVFGSAPLRSDLLAMTLSQLPLTNYPQSPVSNSLICNFPTALAIPDVSSTVEITSQLAGLGKGLTPAGDDFILGAVLAAWIIHPPQVARVLAEEITNTAAPLTTSLSAAWLRSVGKGEAGILWHQFFDALISGGTVRIQEAMDQMLAVGETSGADSLAGFLGTFTCWMARVAPPDRNNRGHQFVHI